MPTAIILLLANIACFVVPLLLFPVPTADPDWLARLFTIGWMLVVTWIYVSLRIGGDVQTFKDALTKQKSIMYKALNELPENTLWGAQYRIMMASGQELPATPQLTKTTLLYGALMAEEIGETLSALGVLLAKTAQDRNGPIHALAASYATTGHDLMRRSADWRSRLLTLPYQDNHMVEVAAMTDFLDGLCDSLVVVMGAAHATGLPLKTAYYDVTQSNLSKANPVTGVIDKTPDGKWIKGVNYMPPDLYKLVETVTPPHLQFKSVDD